MTPLVPVAAAAAARAGPLAARAMAFARSSFPDVAAKAETFLVKASGNSNINAMLMSKNSATNQAVVKTLLDSGLPVRDFMEAAQLTKQEAREYAQLIMAYQNEQYVRVDKQQTKSVSTGDAALDAIVRDQEIDDSLNMLGINSDSYATLLRNINTHTSKDVEQYQLHRKVRRLAFR